MEFVYLVHRHWSWTCCNCFCYRLACAPRQTKIPRKSPQSTFLSIRKLHRCLRLRRRAAPQSKMHCDISRSSASSRERKAVMPRISSGGRTSVLVGHLPPAPRVLQARDELPCSALMLPSLPPERRGAYGAICQRTANRAASARPCSRSTSRLIVLWQTPGLFHSG